MEIKSIIESGILETYVMGIATDEETKRVLAYKEIYPEFRAALNKLEVDMETLAQQMAIIPPTGMLEKIEQTLHEIELRKATVLKTIEPEEQQYQKNQKEDKYIHVESESSHMRIHKAWKWIFAAVFLLGKIFLATAIYFYLENRQAQLQLKELKMELRQKR